MDENILFLKKEHEILLIPKPLERSEIIKKAHALGHFSADSVYKNLKDKFYWSNMIKDINFVCEQCLPCQRNKKYKFKYHPALAINVTAVGDYISLDLVFGLNETVRNHIGLIVIV